MTNARTRVGNAVPRVVRSVQGWTPHRPRLAGAAMGLGAATVLVGCGLANAVTAHGRLPVQVSLVVVSAAVVLGLPVVVAPPEKRMLAMVLCLVVLVIAVPAGFRDAVLSVRGERTPATVTGITRSEKPLTGGDRYECTIRLPDGRETFVDGKEVCTTSTRVGDRVRVYTDPHDLVTAKAKAPTITFPVLGTVVAVATLLLVVVTSRSVGRGRRAP
ncbi:DUF3592 domain-containing protein [Streptomyces sp. NBC_00893]|uniref:DUF3592 domain-containing protein n=1 Tax=Streptomyces sp. NBC_00893 TaxID=2975862 RepID=UPI0022504AC7|nr:DUF3592 domain-containing protein [Streptomyces sp. NBC_00893]MCX4848311.1 DUF3592 domain-containing protein [Streptomyces sp. NBC_00893]